MRSLIDAVEGLLTTTLIAGGESVDDVALALDKVDWSADLKRKKPHSLPVVDAQLDLACDDAIHQYGSNAHVICEALLAERDKIQWHESFENFDDEPDIAVLTRNFAYCTLVGKNAPLASNHIYMGISLQGRDILYPPHVHQATERYWVIGGNGDWKIGQEPWHGVEPGKMIFHETGVRHAMQTNADPLLCVWLWTDHLDSQVVIVRG
jgi:mannose-6-phosphate isomerase-like protein (cupin superfamily)